MTYKLILFTLLFSSYQGFASDLQEENPDLLSRKRISLALTKVKEARKAFQAGENNHLRVHLNFLVQRAMELVIANNSIAHDNWEGLQKYETEINKRKLHILQLLNEGKAQEVRTELEEAHALLKSHYERVAKELESALPPEEAQTQKVTSIPLPPLRLCPLHAINPLAPATQLQTLQPSLGHPILNLLRRKK